MKKISLLLLLVLMSGCASKKAPQGAELARFDGTSITENQFLQKFQTLPPEVRKFASSRRKQFLEDLAAEHFLMKEADRQSIAKDPEVENLLEAARRKIVIARLVEKEIDGKVVIGPEEAQKYYEAHRDEFMTPLTLRASHILVKTQEEATLIKTALLSGSDFEEMARKSSVDATAIRGGDLGFFQKGRFIKEFEDEAFSMKKGELRGPVRSQFGYHLIRLTDRLEPMRREFKDVKGFIEQRLLAEKRSQAFKLFLTKLKGNVKIEIDETKLGALNLT